MGSYITFPMGGYYKLVENSMMYVLVHLKFHKFFWKNSIKINCFTYINWRFVASMTQIWFLFCLLQRFWKIVIVTRLLFEINVKIFFELNINAYLFHSFPLSESDNINIFEMVHVDVWEPFSSETYDQKRYFLTILNDLSKSTYLGVVEAIEIRCLFACQYFYFLCWSRLFVLTMEKKLWNFFCFKKHH